MSYIGNEPIVSATRTVTEVSATAGQTVFTPNGGYTVGFIDVFVNGSKLTNSDFTATNGTTITLNEAAQASDIVRLEALGTFLTGNHVPLVGDSNITGNVNVSGNVGIGTSAPTTRLQIDTASGTATTVTLNQLGAGAGNISVPASTNALAFGVYNGVSAVIERMRIDSSGRVTMPFQPAFQATITFSTGFVNGNYTGWTSQFNIGNHFNASTGVFTAPVAGVYEFTISAIAAGTGYTNIGLARNGVLIGGSFIRPANDQYNHSTKTFLVSLSTNDTITMNDTLGGTQGLYSDSNGWTTFGGKLIG